MDASARDTICAPATAPGAAAIAVVRISGPQALEFAERITGKQLAPRRAEYCAFRDRAGELIDRGIAIYFPGPGSFTGEDVVELQGHGGPVVVDWLLETLHADGARPAEPGEFSLRAYLNDKLDLTRAEAIADLIASGSRDAARAAIRSLEGRFADEVAALQASLTEVRVLCEAWLDFPDEEIDRAGLAELGRRMTGLLTQLDTLQQSASRGVLLNNGLTIAIAGPPNAGKSSLMNRLAGIDAAIVSEIPGTTRDALQSRVVLDGLVVNIVDTAGLREAGDLIEREGVRRAESAIGRSDHVLWVTEISEGLAAASAAAAKELHQRAGAGVRYTVLLNKVDLTTGCGRRLERDGTVVLEISALTGTGIDLLIEHLKDLAGLSEGAAGAFSARRRHLSALERARSHIVAAGPLVERDLELAAEELRGAQAALGELTGEVSSDDLLGEIFSTFCIGK